MAAIVFQSLKNKKTGWTIMLGHVLNAIFWFIKTTQSTKYIYYTTDPLEFYKFYKLYKSYSTYYEVFEDDLGIFSSQDCLSGKFVPTRRITFRDDAFCFPNYCLNFLGL